MRRETITGLTSSTIGIRLTRAETDTLRRASRIAGEIRDTARTINPDWYGSGEDTMLAGLEYNAAETVQGLEGAGFVPVLESHRDPLEAMAALFGSGITIIGRNQ